MSEISLPWPEQDPVVGDGKQYTDVEFAAAFMAVFGEGVLKGYLNELVVTAPSPNTIRIATGAAVVYGRIYRNPAALDLTPASASAGTTRTDYVVLVADWTGAVDTQYAVRAYCKAGAAGTPPALTQTPGSAYEIAIASYTINDAGEISAVTVEGVREWAEFRTLVSTDMIEDVAVTTGKIANLAVTQGKLAAGAVTNSKLGAGAVTPDKITGYSYHSFCWFHGGNLSEGTNNTGAKYRCRGDEIFTGWDIVASTAPTGANAIFDINKNGTTLFATGGKPTLTAGSTAGGGGAPGVTTCADNDVLSCDVDQIGSTVPGADVMVMLHFKRPLGS